MAEGYLDWTAGMTPTAAQIEEYLQLQSVMVFADQSARNTALSAVLREGIVVYLKDSNTLSVYNGAGWCSSGPFNGALISYVPACVQSGSVSTTITVARYQRIGRWITGYFSLAVTGSGTSSNPITVSAPATAAAATLAVGNFNVVDVSAPAAYTGTLFMSSTTTFDFRVSAATGSNQLGTAGMTAGLASGDFIWGQFAYEAAADS